MWRFNQDHTIRFTVATNGVVSYVGGEYCPYCAIQRWALLVALSKFGSFTNLDGQVISSSTTSTRV